MIFTISPYAPSQGWAQPFTIKCIEVWHGQRQLADLVITLDFGSLASWEFADLKSYSNWVSIRGENGYQQLSIPADYLNCVEIDQ